MMEISNFHEGHSRQAEFMSFEIEGQRFWFHYHARQHKYEIRMENPDSDKIFEVRHYPVIEISEKKGEAIAEALNSIHKVIAGLQEKKREEEGVFLSKVEKEGLKTPENEIFEDEKEEQKEKPLTHKSKCGGCIGLKDPHTLICERCYNSPRNEGKVDGDLSFYYLQFFSRPGNDEKKHSNNKTVKEMWEKHKADFPLEASPGSTAPDVKKSSPAADEIHSGKTFNPCPECWGSRDKCLAVCNCCLWNPNKINKTWQVGQQVQLTNPNGREIWKKRKELALEVDGFHGELPIEIQTNGSTLQIVNINPSNNSITVKFGTNDERTFYATQVWKGHKKIKTIRALEKIEDHIMEESSNQEMERAEQVLLDKIREAGGEMDTLKMYHILEDLMLEEEEATDVIVAMTDEYMEEIPGAEEITLDLPGETFPGRFKMVEAVS